LVLSDDKGCADSGKECEGDDSALHEGYVTPNLMESTNSKI
jgi:hypothetical protein